MSIDEKIKNYLSTPYEYDIKVFNHLKEFRSEYNLTQTQLGDICGLSQNTISELENSEYNPSLYTAFKIYFNIMAFFSIYLEFNELFDYEMTIDGLIQ